MRCCCLRVGIAIIAVANVLLIGPNAMAQPELSERHATIISEAYHLWQAMGESVWPGWTATPTPMVFITSEHDFAIGFESALEGFAPSSQRVADRVVQTRPRELDTTLAAAYGFQGVSAVLIGTPLTFEFSPTEWVLTAVHEMSHVMTQRRGLAEKVAGLEIGPTDDASWQLEFPFPYADVDVMRLMHLQGYPIFQAVAAPLDDPGIGYNAGTSIEALEVLKVLLRSKTGDDRAARYAMFQEGEEGVAKYTEYKVAELAAREGYVPLESFQRLEDFVTYETMWNDRYQSMPFMIKHTGRAAKSRTMFYFLGAGKALLLDRIKPNWKDSFFAPDVWLDDLIAEAVGAKTTMTVIATEQEAPLFALPAINGPTVDLAALRGRVVLLDVWQWWCPPCVQALPHLQKLEERFAAQGLTILGLSDRVDESARAKMQEIATDVGLTYPLLIDAESKMMRAYGINSYPAHVLIDANGIVRWVKHGFQPGDEEEIEKQIRLLLGS